MILEFGARNYFSFKEWLTISFRLNKNCPKEISQNEKFTRVLGIKGANASGKTNAIKILDFVSRFCCDSFSLKPEKELDFYTFFSNPDTAEVFVEFAIDETEFRYEVELRPEKVHREVLYRKRKRETKVIERLENKITTAIGEFAELKSIKLRNNASLISTAYQYEVDSIQPIYSFFKLIMRNVHMFGLDSSTPSVSKLSKFYKKYPEDFEFAKNLISTFDSDIKDIVIEEFLQEDGSTKYYPIFFFDTQSPKNYLTFHEQSSGTKTLYCQAARYKFALDLGGLLVLDEFDGNLHPEILPKLLDLFVDQKSNKKSAQFIFTTHNTEILDYLGKYRTYLINKENCESYAYRLDEIPGDLLRNDRSIIPLYRDGKIGGIPKL